MIRLAFGTPGATRSVVVLSPGFLGPDGVSVVARNALSSLATSSLSVRGCSLHEHVDAAEGRGFEGAGGDRARFAARALWSAVSAGRDTLVIALHLHLSPVALAWKCRGARMAVFLHGIEAWTPMTRLRRLALTRADLILTNSRHTWTRAVEANPFLADRTPRICHLGVSSAPQPGALPPGVEPGFVLAVGRLHERYKGHDELLDIWPRLLTTSPTARLVFAGDGPDRGRLEARRSALGLDASVTFVGCVPDDVLSALYRDCAFFALPSRGEGFGLVFLEAMRAGKACLAGMGAAEEVIVADETGLIVDPGRPEELLSGIRRLLEDAALRDRLGGAGRARWEAAFTLDGFGRRLRAALELQGN